MPTRYYLSPVVRGIDPKDGYAFEDAALVGVSREIRVAEHHFARSDRSGSYYFLTAIIWRDGVSAAQIADDHAIILAYAPGVVYLPLPEGDDDRLSAVPVSDRNAAKAALEATGIDLTDMRATWTRRELVKAAHDRMVARQQAKR